MISIIVPVYNVEKYLRECLDSILAQTFTDFELILVDDGSVDSSGAICDEYAGKDERIRVFHQNNQGQGAARNLGVEKAKSEWVLFIDSDDIVHPKLAEYLLNAAIESGASASACPRIQGQTLPADFFEDKDSLYYECLMDENCLVKLFSTGDDIYWTLFPSIIKKDILIHYPLTPKRIYEDNAVCCKWLYDAGKVAVLKEALYFYRDNPTGTMNRPFSAKKLDYLWALEEQIKFYEEISYKKMLGLICKSYVSEAIWMSKEVIKHLNDAKLQKKVLRKAENMIKKYSNGIGFSKSDRCYIEKRLHPLRYKIKRTLKLL